MSQPAITLSVGNTTLALDQDLYWSDEFSWSPIEQSVNRSVTGTLIVDVATKIGGRPITLQPYDDASAWMPGETVRQLQTWEANPTLVMTLGLRNVQRPVIFRRESGQPITVRPVVFVANPAAREIGDWYLVTLRFLEV